MSVKVKYKIGKLEMEAEGDGSFVNAETKALHDFLLTNDGKMAVELPLPQEAAPTVVHNGLKDETVVIYDDASIPSVMRKFSKITNAELFGGSENVHPAFVIGGKEYDEIYISVYLNCVINGKPYSLPVQKLWTNITNDDAARACFSKGDGWHLMTAAEWGLVANICNKNGSFPHGNTAGGKYHADQSECGSVYDYGKTLTGSGPSTWTHNHQPDGIHDLRLGDDPGTAHKRRQITGGKQQRRCTRY